MVYYATVPSRRRPNILRPAELRALAAQMGCSTQSQLAKRLGVTQSRVSQILSGTHPVQPGALLNLVRELQIRHQPVIVKATRGRRGM